MEDKLKMKNAFEAEKGRPMTEQEQRTFLDFVFPTVKGSTINIAWPRYIYRNIERQIILQCSLNSRDKFRIFYNCTITNINNSKR